MPEFVTNVEQENPEMRLGGLGFTIQPALQAWKMSGSGSQPRFAQPQCHR